ncbi:MAG: ROK family protein [Bowdeniella nasicola]|nr:ROK family protein [Bowdeniella nasicola]
MQQNSVRSTNLRAMNMALVLRRVLAADTPPSRAQIAAEASLTRATASRLADELCAGGLLEEVPPPPAVGPGRPACGLLASEGVVGIGAEVGVDALRVLVTTLRGTRLAEQVRLGNLVGSDPRAVLADLAAMIRTVRSALPTGTRTAGCVIALPGLVDVASSRLLHAPNLGWQDVAVTDHVHEDDDLSDYGSLVIGNEANLAALTIALRRPGVASGVRNFAYLSGGIGVGAALVQDGVVVTGEHGWAGEIGHLTVDPNGPSCRCGSTGCLERYVGREALAAALDEGERSPELLRRAAQALGISLSALINLLDVADVVLGGQLAELLERERDTIDATVRRRALAARRIPIRISSASAAEWSVALGASYAAFDDLLANPRDFLVQQRTAASQP